MIFLKVINSCGLLFDIVGAILMYKYASEHTNDPAAWDSSHIGTVARSGHWMNGGKEMEARGKRFVLWGMISLVVGFFLQLIATVLG